MTFGSPMASRESAVGGLLPPLDQWAGSRTVYPRDQTVAALFEQVAAKYPDRAALIFGHSRVTYEELNGRANRCARRDSELRGVMSTTRLFHIFSKSARAIVSGRDELGRTTTTLLPIILMMSRNVLSRSAAITGIGMLARSFHFALGARALSPKSLAQRSISAIPIGAAPYR